MTTIMVMPFLASCFIASRTSPTSSGSGLRSTRRTASAWGPWPGRGRWPPLLAARQLGRVHVGLLGQADLVQQLPGLVRAASLEVFLTWQGASQMFSSAVMWGNRLGRKTMPISAATWVSLLLQLIELVAWR